MRQGRVFIEQLMPDLHVAKSAALRPYARLLTFSAVSLAIALGITLSRSLVFEYHANSGIVGWLSTNAYPKQQEYFFYLLGLLGVPLAIYLYWYSWGLYSRWCADSTGQPIARVLKLNAVASIPLWLCWLQVYPLEDRGLIRLIVPIGLSILLKLMLLLTRYFPRIRTATDNSVTAASNPTGEAVKGVDTGGPKPLDFLRGGLEYILLPIFIYLLNYSGHIHGGIDLFHEGERLAPLNELLHGGIPFRDIYVQHGLFQNAYLAWVGNHLFEPTLFGLRSMERVLEPLGHVAIYLLGLQIFRGRFLTASICMLIGSGTEFFISPRHSLGLISFAFTANFLIHSQDRSNNRAFSSQLLLSGVFASLAFWYSTEIGLYTLAAIGLFLLIHSLRNGVALRKRPLPLVSYSCGVVLGFLPVGIYFLLHGALVDVLWNSYIQCHYQLDTWGLAFPSLSKTLGILSAEGWHSFIFSKGFRGYLPICVFVIVAAYLTYRRLSGPYSINAFKLLLLLLGGVAFFRTALGRSDGGHLIYGSTFLWVLCLFPLESGIVSLARACLSLLRSRTSWHIALQAVWILIPTVVFCWYVGAVHKPLVGGSQKWQRLTQNPFKQASVPEKLGRAGGVDIPDEQVEQIQKVVAYIQGNTEPDEKIFDFSNQGAYYFFADRPSVTRFHQVSYASTPSMQQEVIAALESDKTRLVLFKTGGWFDAVDGIPVEERHPLIAAYLQANYKLAVKINKTEILLRNF